ncbi:MAG: glycosyltransferase [Chloroflexi bacterium]|nr:glycosyltransferase [Chloroflexota bacterium]
MTALIVNWNRRDDLARLLTDLQQQTAPPEEVLVVDDASEDGAPDLVVARFPDVHLVRLPTNVGLAQARNLGLSLSHGEAVALLDNDLRLLDRQFFARLRQALLQHPECAVVSFGMVEGVWTRAQVPPGAHVIPFEQLVELAAQGGSPLPARFWYDWLFYGGACVLRRQLIEQVGGFEPSVRYGSEEIDLAFRCHAAGLALGRDTSLWVVHLRSPQYRLATGEALILRNGLIAQARYLPWPDLALFLLPQTLILLAREWRLGKGRQLLRVLGEVVRAWPREVVPFRRPLARPALRRYYALRSEQTDCYERILHSRATALHYWRSRLQRRPALPLVVAGMTPEAVATSPR